jgi:hypothetical protein
MSGTAMETSQEREDIGNRGFFRGALLLVDTVRFSADQALSIKPQIAPPVNPTGHRIAGVQWLQAVE